MKSSPTLSTPCNAKTFLLTLPKPSTKHEIVLEYCTVSHLRGQSCKLQVSWKLKLTRSASASPRIMAGPNLKKCAWDLWSAFCRLLHPGGLLKHPGGWTMFIHVPVFRQVPGKTMVVWHWIDVGTRATPILAQLRIGKTWPAAGVSTFVLLRRTCSGILKQLEAVKKRTNTLCCTTSEVFVV